MPADTVDGILLSRDLIFTTKITGTASAIGHRLVVVGRSDQLDQAMADGPPRAILIDLAAGDLVTPAALASLRARVPAARLVAFGSHVDTASLDAAREAGCDEVMPRSKFVADFPTLLARVLTI